MNKYKICTVGGAGHVGLPLSIAFANSKQKTIIYDINQKALDAIDKGIMPFRENGAEQVLKRTINKTLFTSNDIKSVHSSEFVVVVIGTPVDKHLNPTFRQMKIFFENLLPYMKNDQIIIIRSTVFPSTTTLIRDLAKKIHPKIEVCFCPERIAEGNAMDELYNLPQIVSGFDEKAIKKTASLFRKLTKDIIITSPFEAELAKLFTNSWRYIQFAIANQFYMIAEEHGADFYKIFDAMTYKYPRTKDFPKPGYAAGPCLFKDTMQISAFTHNSFFLGHSAMLINEGLPVFVINQMKNEIPNLREKVVGILGMAFKSESDDARESLSYKLKQYLEVEAKEVLCTDEYVNDSSFLSLDAVINKSDVLVIGSPHKKYRNADLRGRKVYDVWNIVRR
ncbi:MAG: nucleotide sugar dehydrogenase [bacterium]